MDYSVKAKEISEEQQMFVDIWEHYKKFYRAENTDEYWTEQIAACQELQQKYQDSKLAKDMLLAISKELERKAKEEEEWDKMGRECGLFRTVAGKDIKAGEEKEFPCPICGGLTHAHRNTNGHLWASCSKCGLGTMQ